MRVQTNLIRRGAIYYFRSRVPEDLKTHYNKSELFVSLRTSNRKDAERALAILKAMLYEQFSKLRNEPAQAVHASLPFSIAVSAIKPHPQHKGPTLDELIDYWASQNEKRPRTLMEVNTAKQRLLSLIGNKTADQIEKKHAIMFKDHLLAGGLSIASIQKHINLLKAVFEVGATNEKIASNPFKGIKLIKPKVTQKARVPFSANDLKQIFSSEIFTNGLRPKGGAGEAVVWLPRIAMWTGMRLEEIGQLLVSDIRIENDIYIFSVDADAISGKRIKTNSSRRRVPIHPMLIEAGLIDYVEQQRKSGKPRLFPLISSIGSRLLIPVKN